MSHPRSRNEQDKKALVIGGLLILSVGIYFIGKDFFFQDEEADPLAAPVIIDKQTGVPLITADVLLKKTYANDTLVLLDIRDEAAFQSEHIAHSLSLPIGSLENFSPNKDETVVIIFSESDPTLFEAAKNILKQKSFAYVFLQGGFEGWKALQAPTVSVGTRDSFLDQSKVTYVSVEKYKLLAAQENSSLFLLDIQTADNFQKRHLKGATNIPLALLEKRRNEIPAGRSIVVYGENSLISFQGGVRLADLGIFSAQTLEGDKHLSPESGLSLEP